MNLKEFRVTRRHIAVGTQNHSRLCPVATALRQTIKNETIRVRPGYIFCTTSLNNFAKDQKITDYRLSRKLQCWILNFDNINYRDRHKKVSTITVKLQKDLLFIENEFED